MFTRVYIFILFQFISIYIKSIRGHSYNDTYKSIRQC